MALIEKFQLSPSPKLKPFSYYMVRAYNMNTAAPPTNAPKPRTSPHLAAVAMAPAALLTLVEVVVPEGDPVTDPAPVEAGVVVGLDPVPVTEVILELLTKTPPVPGREAGVTIVALVAVFASVA